MHTDEPIEMNGKVEPKTEPNFEIDEPMIVGGVGNGNGTLGGEESTSPQGTVANPVSPPGAPSNGMIYEYGNQTATLSPPDVKPKLRFSPDINWEIQARDRSNTWPKRPPAFELMTSGDLPPTIKDEEASTSYDTPMQQASSGGSACTPFGSSDSIADASQHGISSTIISAGGRRNPWGNQSYSDLITSAIMSTPEKRLTLAQIYDWMIKNVTYFGERADTTSAAGWKNSVRHNLSLHSRFVRVQNEEAGKSSWWTCSNNVQPPPSNSPGLNSSHTHLYQPSTSIQAASGSFSPDSTSSSQRRAQRRRATVETSNHQMITARNRVRAKVGKSSKKIGNTTHRASKHQITRCQITAHDFARLMLAMMASGGHDDSARFFDPLKIEMTPDDGSALKRARSSMSESKHNAGLPNGNNNSPSPGSSNDFEPNYTLLPSIRPPHPPQTTLNELITSANQLQLHNSPLSGQSSQQISPSCYLTNDSPPSVTATTNSMFNNRMRNVVNGDILAQSTASIDDSYFPNNPNLPTYNPPTTNACWQNQSMNLPDPSMADLDNLCAAVASPSWQTGGAVTCDVNAVIQHELRLENNMFNFNNLQNLGPNTQQPVPMPHTTR